MSAVAHPSVGSRLISAVWISFRMWPRVSVRAAKQRTLRALGVRACVCMCYIAYDGYAIVYWLQSGRRFMAHFSTTTNETHIMNAVHRSKWKYHHFGLIFKYKLHWGVEGPMKWHINIQGGGHNDSDNSQPLHAIRAMVSNVQFPSAMTSAHNNFLSVRPFYISHRDCRCCCLCSFYRLLLL